AGALRARHRAGERIGRRFEFEGGFPGLAIACGHIPHPFASHIGGRGRHHKQDRHCGDPKAVMDSHFSIAPLPGWDSVDAIVARMTPSPPLRGGIVGCGFFAQFHIEGWRRMPDVELAAAADPDLARARKAAPHAYATAEAMLDGERLDFVDIATRPDSHAALVRLAASRKVPVICQKPMAPNWADAVGMVEA